LDLDHRTERELPRLTSASVSPTREIEVFDEYGDRRVIHIPDERPLDVYVDKREVVTLMTLGMSPELLVLGYLRNQRLIDSVYDIESITVDWDVGAAAVKTRGAGVDIDAKTARRSVTTGCGQGTMFGEWLDDVDGIQLPESRTARIRQSTLAQMLEVLRAQPSIHRQAGSVHGCALFRIGAPTPASPPELMTFHEDVGRHNALDTIAGWMAMNGVSGHDKAFYTTGRLTSEMVMKAALMGVPIVVSRNGVTAMGHAMATRLCMSLFGRAANRHFLCYCGAERFDAEPLPTRPTVRVVSG
jgi:FdhD protein